MTLETNEQKIYKKLKQNRSNLYTVLRSKINSETNDYFYSERDVSYTNYSPTLDSSLEVVKYSSNSNAFVDQGNGVVSLKGAVLKNGWQNTLWEMSVDIQFYSSVHKVYATTYIGFILLTDADNPFPYHDYYATHIGWGIAAWENGYIAGTPQLQDNSVGTYTKTPNSMLSVSGNRWYTLHVKKISQTVLEVWLNDDIQNKVVYDWNELSDADNVTFGCVTNPNDVGSYGSLLIRNLTVNYLDNDNIPDTMTKLCEDSKLIKSDVQNSATLPPEPTIIDSNRLGVKEHNIHNKIQYCNNLLRYTLRKNGIEFNNSNKMHELIRFINQIITTSTIDIDDIYSAYVNPIQLSGDKSIVQANETYNLIAEVVDKGAGINVDFIQKNQQLYSSKGETVSSLLANWYNLSNSANTVTKNSDEITISTDGTYSGTYMQVVPSIIGTTYRSYERFVVECDIISTSNFSIMFPILKSDGTNDYPSTGTNTGHIKFEVTRNGYKMWIDGVLKNHISTSVDKCRFYFQSTTSRGSGDITFKNLQITKDEKVYPVDEIIFEDKATTSTHNDNWAFRNCTDSIRTRDDTGTLLDVTGVSISVNANVVPNTDNFYTNYIQPNTVLEFEVLDVDTTNDMKFTTLVLRTSTNSYPYINLANYKPPFKVKILHWEDKVVFCVNNNIISSYSYEDIVEYRPYFVFEDGKGKYVKFRNFKMYHTTQNIITNVNGIATYELLGDGSGLETYYAKYGNIESGAIDIIDGVFKDIGTDSNYTDWTYTNNATLSRSTSETTMTQISSSSAASQYVSLPITDEFCIEFDLSLSDNSVSSYSVFSFRQGTSSQGNVPYTRLGLIDDKYSHIKMIVSGNTVNLIVDGVSKPDLTLTNAINRFYIGANQGVSLKYKNFVIYPLESE